MRDYSDTSEREEMLSVSLSKLEKVNKKIAALSLEKEELVNNIVGALGHEKEGQKTYEYGVYKIEVKTPLTYSLNKALYEEIKGDIPTEYNPIKSSLTYTVDKRLCEKYKNDSPIKVKRLLSQIIDEKMSKPSITLKPRVA